MFPTSNLQPGQTGPEVQKLQQFLLSQGLLTQDQINTGPGIYGPQTTAAVAQWQQNNNVDNTSGPGYWGPKSIDAASKVTSSTPTSSNLQTINPATNQPWTSQEIDQIKQTNTDALKNHPIVSKYATYGNTAEEIANAYTTGDWSKITNETGMPFSIQDQQEALNKAKEQDAAFYDQQKVRETQDSENALAQKQADYQDYLLNSGQQFAQDKIKADQTAANNGVLFSGGRIQKEKNLERSYNQDQASKQATIGRNISSTAQDYQYKYGNNAANNLSKYYSLGGNTYNANTTQNGVGSTGLANVYNPSQSNFAGTRIGEQYATANKKASGMLWNKGNKLLASGYNNQYK